MDYKTMQNMILATFPGLPVQIVKAFINTTYRELLRCWEWSATLKSYTLVTKDAYDTGTVDVALNSREVVGTTTVWTADMAGRKIRFGTYQPFEIASVTDATHMTLTAAYNGTTAINDLAYSIVQDVYALNPAVIEMYNINHDVKLTEVDLDYLDRIDPQRTGVGSPLYYCKFGKVKGSLRIIIYPTPQIPYQLTYSARIAPPELSYDEDIPLLDGDLIVKGTLMNLCGTYARMGHPEIMQENQVYREQYTEAKTDAMMEDMRNQSTAKVIRDVYGLRGDITRSNTFRYNHDV